MHYLQFPCMGRRLGHEADLTRKCYSQGCTKLSLCCEDYLPRPAFRAFGALGTWIEMLAGIGMIMGEPWQMCLFSGWCFYLGDCAKKPIPDCHLYAKHQQIWSLEVISSEGDLVHSCFRRISTLNSNLLLLRTVNIGFRTRSSNRYSRGSSLQCIS